MDCQELAKLATQALYDELITYPKPGLVSLIDSGSHKDMDYTSFIQSINCLSSYFEQIARAGKQRESFAVLKQLGQDAEAAMLKATGGINTHRGAIFILGLLVAATASLSELPFNYGSIRLNLIKLWSKDILLHQPQHSANGAKIRQQYLLKSNIVSDAADGFPLIFSLVVSYGQLCNEVGIANARIITFMMIMRELDDTNLIHRGGMNGLIFAKTRAAEVLQKYALDKTSLYAEALILHKEFIMRNLSPGGAADILSGVLFISSVKLCYPGRG